MTSTLNATGLLAEWVSFGYLDSQYESYLRQVRTSPRSFYTQTLEREGKEAAERWLREEHERSCAHSYAGGIAPIGRGLLALAHAGCSSICLAEFNGRMLGSGLALPLLAEPMVIFFNDRRSHVNNGYLFGPDELFGLRAVGLQAGRDSEYPEGWAQLFLFFARRSLAGSRGNPNSSVVLTVEPNGCTQSMIISGSLSLLPAVLGITSWQEAANITGGSGTSLESNLGYPGATQTIASALPELGAYLTELAAA